MPFMLVHAENTGQKTN